jgi:hypothetical protein
MPTRDDWKMLYEAAGLKQGICDLALLWRNLRRRGVVLPDLGPAMGGETLSLIYGQLPSDKRWNQIGDAICNNPNVDCCDLILRLFEFPN